MISVLVGVGQPGPRGACVIAGVVADVLREMLVSAELEVALLDVVGVPMLALVEVPKVVLCTDVVGSCVVEDCVVVIATFSALVLTMENAVYEPDDIMVSARTRPIVKQLTPLQSNATHEPVQRAAH